MRRARRGPAGRVRAPGSPPAGPAGGAGLSWASEATTCTSPSRSSVVVKRRTVEPNAAGHRARRDLHQRPGVHERLEARGIALEGGAALRVGEQHAVAAGVQVEHHRLEVADPGRERALDEQVGTAAERQRAQHRRRRARSDARSRSRRPAAPRAGSRAAASAARSASMPAAIRAGSMRGSSWMWGVARIVRVPAATAARASLSEPSIVAGPSSTPGRMCECRSITPGYDRARARRQPHTEEA